MTIQRTTHQNTLQILLLQSKGNIPLQNVYLVNDQLVCLHTFDKAFGVACDNEDKRSNQQGETETHAVVDAYVRLCPSLLTSGYLLVVACDLECSVEIM